MKKKMKKEEEKKENEEEVFKNISTDLIRRTKF